MAAIMRRGGKFWVRWREGGRGGKNRSITVKTKVVAEILRESIERDMAIHGTYLGPTGSKARREKRDGVVYFVFAAGRIKIGFTTNLAIRITELQIGCPFPVTLLGTIDGSRADERRWHRHFQDANVHGEWFDARPVLVEEIMSYATLALPADEVRALVAHA